MTLRKNLAILSMTALLCSAAQAAPPDAFNQFTSQLSNDSSILSGWISNQLKYVIPFNSTSGNVIPTQLKVLGFEFGVAGVVSATELDNGALHSLNTQLINTQSIDSFSRLPFPMVLGQAKIGLPFGLDAGVRFGGIPKTNINNGNTKSSIQNTVIGIDLRKKIIEEGISKPFGLTMGFNYTHANGSVDITNTFNSRNTTITSGGTTYTASLNNGTAADHADWSTDSYGIQAILDKKILIFTPYIGASANYNSGNISNSITASGTAAFTDGSSQNVSASGSSASAANSWDLRALFGFDFTILPFTRLGLQGEYAGDKNIAGSLGLRVQFGGV